MVELVLLGAAAFLAVGVLFNPRSAVVWLGATGAMWEGHFLLAVLVQRTLVPGTPVRAFLVTAATIFILLWAWLWWREKPRIKLSAGIATELTAGLLTLVVVASAHLVVTNNGFSASDWVTSGFYNGDTVTFGTLVERSRSTTGLVATNPFAANGPLEYPTLLHAGVATLFSLVGLRGSWLHFLPHLTLVQVFITIPMFFLLWEASGLAVYRTAAVARRTRIGRLLLQALIVAYVLSISWDNYIYPQSHFFLTGLFALLAAIWVRGYSKKGIAQLPYVLVGSLIALVLLRSNAVTGTAAVGLTMVWFALRFLDHARTLAERAMYALGIFAWLLVYLAYTPGQNSFGFPGISYTAAHDILPFSALLLALMCSSFAARKQMYLPAASAALSCLAVATYLFSTRDIVIDNAARFLYHAALVGFPLLYAPLLHGYYYLRQALKSHSDSLAELSIGWASVAVAAFLFALPGAASVLHSFDDLLFKDTQVVPAVSLAAMEWITSETSPDAIFLASPARPWIIPLFTGRALVRTHYWLSPEDPLANEVNAAFKGNVASQARAMAAADYLVLTAGEIPQWQTPPGKITFQNSYVVIYQLR